MKRGWIVASLAFLAFFAFAIHLSLKLPQMDELGPGPGFFPFWLAGIGAVLSVLLVVETARAPDEPGAESLWPDRAAMGRILSLIVLLAAAAGFLEVAGWRITAAVFAVGVLVALGARQPIALVAFAAAASLGVFHVFYYWLKVPLPIGTFGI